MKKPIILILALSLCLCLYGCSNSQKRVPDRILMDDLEQEFASYVYGDCSYDVAKASHSYDKETHIDSVSVDVEIDYRCSVAHMIATCEYQYNRATDTWEVYREMEHTTDYIEYKPEEYLGYWEGTFGGLQKNKWSMEITAIDFENMTVSLQFWAEFSESSVTAAGNYTLSESWLGPTFSITMGSGRAFVFILNGSGVEYFSYG